ncbi:MAG: hypothetical protein J7647_02245 [Cyanobacteria bacterium SBLK]|nr:hypothetical protein [Cyanobacteria bacterium SBLK]
MNQKIETLKDKRGLFKNVPKFLRTLVRQRLREWESDRETFDRLVLENRARLKRLYALLHVKPDPYAQKVLFENKPPEGTPLQALRQIAKEKNPEVAATLVRQHRLPFLLVESALESMPSDVALAAIASLSLEELLARLPLMGRRGLIQGELREELLQRLQTADRSQTLSYQQAEAIVRKANLDRDLSRAIFALAQVQDRQDVKLSGNTALIVDVSASMPREGECLELAARVAFLLDAALVEGSKMTVIACDRDARSLTIRRGADVGVWRERMHFPAKENSNLSSLGVGVEYLTVSQIEVQRLIIVSDGYENHPPRLAGAIARYRQVFSCYPSVNLVQPPNSSRQLAVDLKNAQLGYAIFNVDRHFIGLNALLPCLARQQNNDIITQILNYPLAF